MASPHLVLEATVTAGAKPHGQQQLARDLERWSALSWGSAVGLKVSARCSDVCTVAAQAMNARRIERVIP